MRAVVVLPSIDVDYTRACLATARFVENVPVSTNYHGDTVIMNGRWEPGDVGPRDRLVAVYNTPRYNRGVAGSWNLGIEEALASEAEWLVLLSAAVRFGPPGGLDFLAALTDPNLEFPHGIPALEAGDGLGWHLIAFRRDLLLRVGYFDEMFLAYMEDIDYSRRIQLAYGVDSMAPGFVGPLWPKVPVDARLDSVAHGIKRGGVVIDFAGNERIYRAKWGGLSQHEVFDYPYNDPTLAGDFIGAYPMEAR